MNIVYNFMQVWCTLLRQLWTLLFCSSIYCAAFLSFTVCCLCPQFSIIQARSV